MELSSSKSFSSILKPIVPEIAAVLDSFRKGEEVFAERVNNVLRLLAVGILYLIYVGFYLTGINYEYHYSLSFIVMGWLLGSAVMVYHVTGRERVSWVYKYASVSMDLIFLALTLLFVNEYRPILFGAYFLIITASSLRFSFYLPLYAGLVAVVLNFGVTWNAYGLWNGLFSLGFFLQTTLLLMNGILVSLLADRTRGLIERSVNSLVEQAEMRSLLNRYVSEPVAQKLTQKDEVLEDADRDISILIADIRGYTSFSRNLPPQRSLELLNTYFSRMTEIVFDQEGTLDKFMGDGLMALFGAPVIQSDHTERAVTTAVSMQSEMGNLNEELQEKGLPEIDIGIGVSTGEAVVGEVGSDTRKDYTAIGPNVNLAKRLESQADGGEVIVSDSVVERLGERLKAERIGRLKMLANFDLRGISETIEAYNVLEFSDKNEE